MSDPDDITSVGIYATRYSRDVMGLPDHGELPRCFSAPSVSLPEDGLAQPFFNFIVEEPGAFFPYLTQGSLPAQNIITSFDLASASAP
ncbi:hypothetical protein [Dickeya poaceiphila]|uniref:Uncharacterized protein n=1 Tax=Dickeya poaceiphila TaxID=568768 RepID=A0A5B8I5J1_9GAMM|nr:hypothetical protein [Dickeya poaceiphila]QDX28450.1 hypothetical protein Dpoa569_0000083 [Dickeya poaceiphila]